MTPATPSDYGTLHSRLPGGTPITVLHIGVEHTVVATGSGPEPQSVLVLAVGVHKTAADFFHHTPPTPGEIENAIMVVEDEVNRARHQVVGHPTLLSTDPALHALADFAGAAPADTVDLSIDAVERLFDLLAALSQGRPASIAGIPSDTHFAARLLILREFMHHLHFASIRLVPA